MSVVPFPSYKTCNSTIAKQFAKDICSFLKNNNDLTNIKSMLGSMKYLLRSFFDLSSFCSELSTTLLEHDFLTLSYDILQKINQKGYFQNDVISHTVYYFYTSIWNFSDYSYDFAVSILDTDIPKLLISTVLHEPYRKNLKSKNIYDLLKSSLSIINNIARHPGKATLFRRDDIKQALVEFIRINDSDFLGIISMLLLANLVNENELHLLDEGKSTIKILIGKIITAKAESPPIIDGFAMWELINGLKQIAVNDNMKKAVVRENGINVIIDILKNPTCDEDIEHSLCVVWNLCFDSDIRNVLDGKVKDVIKDYSNHKNLEIKKAHDGIMWLLDQNKTSVERIKSDAANRSKTKEVTKWKFDGFMRKCETSTIICAAQQGIRLDGRELNSYRPLQIEYQKNGSIIKLGETYINTQISLDPDGKPLLISPNEGHIKFSLKFNGSRKSDEELDFFKDLLVEAYKNCNVIDLSQMCITPFKKCWVLFVDVLIMEQDGNLLDAISIGIKTAFQTVKPLNISSEKSSNQIPVSYDECPIFITINKVDAKFLVDCCSEEEICVISRCYAAIKQNSYIASRLTCGEASITVNNLLQMLKMATELGVKVHEEINEFRKVEIAKIANTVDNAMEI